MMPLLHKKKFVRKKPPKDLNPAEEVFFCSATHEIFRNYEEFFERTILVNSLVWTCEVCGKGELTYEEAQECEYKALKALSVFSNGLKRGIIALIDLTYRSSINLLADDVSQFIKERYFLDEPVDFTPQSEKKIRTGRVIRVIHSNSDHKLNGDVKGGYSPKKMVNGGLATIDLTESDDEIQIVKEENSPSQSMAVSSKESSNGNVKNSNKSNIIDVPAPSSLQYIIQDNTSTNKTFCVPSSKVSRQKGVISRDRMRNFIKMIVEMDKNIGFFRVNRTEARRRFGLSGLTDMSWNNVFGGSQPKFMKAPLSSMQHFRMNAANSQSKKSKSKKKTKSEKDASKKINGNSENKKKKKQKERNERPHSPSDEKTLQQIMMEQEAARQKEKADEMQREWRRLEEEMRRRENEKQARLAERERHKEEKRLKDVLIREWSRLRDDLACDDLRVLPTPTLIETKIPTRCFGDALAVIEFFSTFMDTFDLRSDLRGFASNSHHGPRGCLITFNVLEKALVSKDPNGHLSDIFFALLTALQKLQQREDRDEVVVDEDDDSQTENYTESAPSKVYSHRLHDAVRAASQCVRTSRNRFGETLSQVHLDSMTLTEVLRLHLLSSGARVSRRVALSRWRYRGGMTNLDDPGLHFSRTESHGIELISRMERTNLFDLPASDKLILLRVLMDQLLTYACGRQAVEGSFERSKALKSEIRTLLISLQRAERNIATLKLRRKQAKKSQIEQAIAAATLNAKENDDKEKENKKEIVPKTSLSPVNHKPVTRKGKQESNSYLTKDPSTIDPKDITDELIQEAEVALGELKVSVSEKENELMDNLVCALGGYSGPVALGRDRAYRRYWLSRGLSGLLVESPGIDFDAERKALLAEAKVCKQFQSDTERFSLEQHSKTGDGMIKFVTSWDTKEQIANEHPVHTQWQKLVQETCSGSEQWYFFPDMISIDDLSDSLNQRGFRESALKTAIVEYRSIIEDALDCCPVHDLVLSATESAKIAMKAEEEEENESEDKPKEEPMEQNGTDSDKKTNQKSKLVKVKKVVTFGLKSRGSLVNGRAISDRASEWMELNLRESLLDLEERIHAGALGSLKVDDRDRWRNVLEQGGYESLVEKPPLVENGNAESPAEKVENLDDHEMDEDSNATVAAKQDEISERVVRDLSSALIQIANGLQTRFIIAPLGDHDQATKEAQRKAKIQAKLRKQQERERREKLKASRQRSRNKQNIEDICYSSSSSSEDEEVEESGLSTFERWQQGLQMATSLSQISLYLSALDRSISWSKSLLKARCKKCRRKGEDSQLLLCDSCDSGFHMYCLKPRLTKVPVGDWFCPGCRPPEPVPEPPRKTKKKVVKVESEEEEEDDADTDAGDDEATEAGKDSDDEESNESTEGEEDGDSEEEEEEEEEDDDDEEGSENENESGEENSEEDNDDEESPDENENDSRRRSSRRRESSRSRTAKVKLPLVTPRRTSRTQTRNSTGSARLSSGRRSNPTEKAVASSLAGFRGRLKRGHPDAEALRDVEILVNELVKEDDAWPFLNAVRKSEVPDYYDIIKYPMDLGLMRVNFNRLAYENPQQPMNDIWRIFSNCETYNHIKSEEYQCSTKLRRFTEKRVRELGLTKYMEKAIKVISESSSNSSSHPSKKRTRIT